MNADLIITNRNHPSLLLAVAASCLISSTSNVLAGGGVQPFSITRHPQSVQATAGDAVTFSVEVSGGPVTYQWQKDQVDIPGATNSRLTIAIVSIGNSGIYRVVVSNSFGIETSSDAVLTVFQDSRGPMMLSAVAGTNTSNRIDVTFDEAVRTSTITTNNLQVIRSGTSGPTARRAPVTSALISARTVRIYLSSDWDLSSCYYIRANHLTDDLGSAIAADSVIGVVMPGRASACPVPPDPPLAQLRLSIQKDGDGTRISWPPGYHGFTLEATSNFVTSGLFFWRATTNQDNGALVPPGPDRLFRLRR